MSDQDQGNKDKGFLARWSQRKREAEQPKPAAAAVETVGPSGPVAEGDATPSYGGQLSMAKRQLWYLRTVNAVLIRDRLSAIMPHTYEFNLHAPTAIVRSDDIARACAPLVRQSAGRVMACWLPAGKLRATAPTCFAEIVEPPRSATSK